MNKNKLIPEFRFPEFVNDGEWEEKELNKLAKRLLLKNKNGIINRVFTNSATDGIVEQREYFDKDIADINNLENYYLVEPDDFVYNPRISIVAPVGPISKNKTNKTGAMSPLYTVFRFTDKNNGFYEYYFKSVHWYSSIRKASNTGARFDRMSITDSVFMDILVLYPYPKEQQKIASCLSSIDEVIAAHNQKLDFLKGHKKGLMQSLFPQEGEKVPKYRFKEFEKDGDWTGKSLLETADKKVKWSFTGGPFGSNLKASDYTAEGFRIIQLQNIGDGEFNNEYKIYTSEEKADELLSCNIYQGEIIISKMGDPVGRACIIPNFLNRCVMASDGIRLVVDESKYSKYYVFSLINSKRIREAIEKKATGSTRKRIGLDELKGIELMMPKKLAEQQKIASCLSTLDALIAAQAEKIEQLKLHKKGLMQGLFPKIYD